jgi:hypothetical protein
MSHQLPGLIPGIGKTEAVNDTIQPSFQKDEQVFARNPLFSLRLLEIIAELLLQNSINPLNLLFLPELIPKFRKNTPRFSVLPRGIGLPVDGTLIGITAIPLEKELEVFPPTEPTFRVYISSQDIPP